MILAATLLHYQIVAATLLPPRLYPDPFLPFAHGVASGDPFPNAVTIWTRRNPEDPYSNTAYVLRWETSTEPSFGSVLSTNQVTAEHLHDWCVSVDISLPTPNTWYYYRFVDILTGNISVVGRTRTAVEASSTEEVTIAVASCSSMWSGYFHAWADLANRSDVNALIHLGDETYEFVSDQEEVRVPKPCNLSADPLTDYVCVRESEGGTNYPPHIRNMVRQHLLDPDYRLLRARLPIVSMWDNHDVFPNEPETYSAFHDYWPIQTTAPFMYRKLSFGKMVDFFATDEISYRTNTTFLGFEQIAWLTAELENSVATWRLIGSEKMFTRWSAEVVPRGIGIPNAGTNNMAGNWDDYMTERTSLLSFFKQKGIRNNVIISGDMHIGLVADLYDFEKLQNWNKSAYCPLDYIGCTGVYDGVVGVEFAPPSITRVNLDERLGTDAYNVFLNSGGVLPYLTSNPHHRWYDMTSHGYGWIVFKNDGIVARIRTFDKYKESLQTKTGEKVFYSCSWDKYKARKSFSNRWDTAINDCSCPLRPETDCVVKQLAAWTIALIVLGSLAGVVLFGILCCCPVKLECCRCCKGKCTAPAVAVGADGCCARCCGERCPSFCICCHKVEEKPNDLQLDTVKHENTVA